MEHTPHTPKTFIIRILTFLAVGLSMITLLTFLLNPFLSDYLLEFITHFIALFCANLAAEFVTTKKIKKHLRYSYWFALIISAIITII